MNLCLAYRKGDWSWELCSTITFVMSLTKEESSEKFNFCFKYNFNCRNSEDISAVSLFAPPRQTAEMFGQTALRSVYLKLSRGAQGFITEINSASPGGVLRLFTRVLRREGYRIIAHSICGKLPWGHLYRPPTPCFCLFLPCFT
jgi:hypothetical protein